MLRIISDIINQIILLFTNGKESIEHTFKILLVLFITLLIVSWIGVQLGMNVKVFKLNLQWNYFNYASGAFFSLVIFYLILNLYKYLLQKLYFSKGISHKWTIDLLDSIYTFLSVVAIAYFLGIKDTGYNLFINYLIDKYINTTISNDEYQLIAEYIRPYYDIIVTYIAASISCTAVIITKLKNEYYKNFQSKHT